ncbi:MAG TPA: hypothetical protein VEK11_15645 [Thermoanaerobaculia bacterium]|nr:hypothetical protein [Thermoanaerobaculia bacterium]
MRTKFIVTNVSRLKAKYGTKYSRVEKAIQQLIDADAARAITSTVWDVSSTARMKEAGGTKVTRSRDPQQNKDAIDAIFQHGQPDYLMILGSVDVIPHQDLANPLLGIDDDLDEFAWGDLPYACEHPYSTDVKDFRATTRVVGRVPDLTGAKDPKHLVKVLGVAATWVPLAPKHYDDYFALSTESWQESTKLSIERIFGRNKNIHISPTAGPRWNNGELDPLPHFINCHGDTGRMMFWGENADATDQPESHRTTLVRNKIGRGTVAAVECCYGAELYKPGTSTSDKEHGICQEYLHGEAYAFFGSTTIAYGPANEMEAADIICAAFLQHVRAGDSTGLAALKARQDFVKEAKRLSAIEQKTLAQFNLLGDPSVHPVQAGSKATKKTMAKPKGMLGMKSAVHVAEAQPALDDGHRTRRAQLAKRGPRIAAETAAVRAIGIVNSDEADRARAAVEEHGGNATRVVAYEMIPPAVLPKSKAKLKALGMASTNEAVPAPPMRTYLVRAERPKTSVENKGKTKPPRLNTYSVCVVEEQRNGTMKVVQELFAK